MNQIQIVIVAVKSVFKRKRFFIYFIFLALLSLWLFIYIPVKQIPGNTFAFQTSIFTSKDWFLLIVLSILTSTTLVMNIFAVGNDLKNMKYGSTLGRGSVGILSGIAGSIFGPTATCAACVGTIFGFLGVGGIFLLLKYRQAIVVLSISIMLFTLYYTSKRVLGICNIKVSRRR